MSADQPSCACRTTPRGRFEATVEVNRPVCREHFLLRLRIAPGAGAGAGASAGAGGGQPAFPPTRPGQFIQLGCRPPNGVLAAETWLGRELEWQPAQPPTITQPEVRAPVALLRRPFSLAGRGDDARGTWLEVIHRVVGVGTRWLADLRPGDALDLIGPLGNAFELPADKDIGLLVGGGVGLPPMFYLAEALHAAKWQAVAFVGALSRDLLALTLRDGVAVSPNGQPALAVAEFARFGYPTVLTTNDGSCGLSGFITAGLERHLAGQSRADAARTVIFTCGPNAMMHAVAKLAAKHGVDCQVCLEQAMACGMGTCQSCVVKIEDHERPQATTSDGRPWRYRLACTDGPVFPAGRVVW